MSEYMNDKFCRMTEQGLQTLKKALGQRKEYTQGTGGKLNHSAIARAVGIDRTVVKKILDRENVTYKNIEKVADLVNITLSFEKNKNIEYAQPPLKKARFRADASRKLNEESFSVQKMLQDYDEGLQERDLIMISHKLVSPYGSSFDKKERIPEIAYRNGLIEPALHLLQKTINLSKKYNVQLPDIYLSKLLNHIGDLYWMTGRSLKEADDFHIECQELAKQCQDKDLIAVQFNNRCLCFITAGLIEEAESCVDDCINFIESNREGKRDLKRIEVMINCTKCVCLSQNHKKEIE